MKFINHHAGKVKRRQLSPVAILKYLLIFALVLIGSGCATNKIETDTASDSIADPSIADKESKPEGTGTTEPTKNELISAGDNAWNSGDTEKALFEYLRALKLDENDKDIYFKIGLVHEYEGNTNLATLAYAKCNQLDPGYIPALERMGILLLKRRKYIEARLSFERAIALDQKRLQQQAILKQGKVLGVEKLVKTASFPDDAIIAIPDSSAAELMANAKTGILDSATTGKLEDASPSPPAPLVPEFDNKSPFYAYNGLGVIEDLEGNHYKATRDFHIASSIAPDSASIYNNMGYSSYMADDFDIAEILFKKAVSKDPKYKIAWRNLALVYVRLERYDQAIDILSAKVDGEASAYNTIGYLCMLEGKHQRAEIFLKKAIDLAPAYFVEANENLKKNRELSARKTYGRN